MTASERQALRAAIDEARRRELQVQADAAHRKPTVFCPGVALSGRSCRNTPKANGYCGVHARLAVAVELGGLSDDAMRIGPAHRHPELNWSGH